MRRLTINSLLLSSSSLVAQALVALTYWLTARSLGPSAFGPVIGAIGLATLSVTFLDFGVNSVTIRQLAKHPEEVGYFSTTLGAKLLSGAVFGALWVTATGLIALETSDWWTFAPLGIYVSLVNATATINVPARAAQRMGPVSTAAVVERMATLTVATPLIIGVNWGAISLPLGMVFGALASLLVSLRMLPKQYRTMTIPSLADFRELWSSSLGFGIGSLVSQIQRLDVTIVAAIAGAREAGIFGAPARMTGLLGVLPSAVAAALFPQLSASSDPRVSRREALRVITVMMVPTVIALSATFLAAPFAIEVFLGPAYRESTGVLRIYLVSMIPACLNGPLAAVLQAEGQERYVAFVVAVGAAIGLAGVTIGSAFAGATGAAAGFLALQAVITAGLAWGFRRSPLRWPVVTNRSGDLA